MAAVSIITYIGTIRQGCWRVETQTNALAEINLCS